MRAWPTSVDCLIVGGGPAGAALAGLLARDGAEVLLVDDGRPRFAAPLETLLPSALAALDRCALGAIVRTLAEPDRRRHGACWREEQWQWRDEMRPGLCLRRGGFDDGLRAWAVAGGALLARPAQVVRLPAAPGELALLRTAAGAHHCRARCTVVAAGRRRLVTLLPMELMASGPVTATFAVRTGGGDGAMALVAAANQGWCWWIGDGQGAGIAIATVDGDELRRRGRHALLTELFAELAAPMPAIDPAVTMMTAVRATTQRWRTKEPVLLLGDAAATLDALASQGTEKALVGAEAAAVAVRTALVQPALAPLALAHHARWERDLFAAHCREAAGFYRLVERFAGAPFWQRRRSIAADAVDAGSAEMPGELVVAPDLRLVPMLQRRGPELTAIDGFAIGADDDAARSHVGRVAIGPVLAAFASPQPLATGVRAAGQDPRLYVLGAATVRHAAAALWRQGFLVAAAQRPTTK